MTDYPATRPVAALSISTDKLLGFKQTKETLSPNLCFVVAQAQDDREFFGEREEIGLQYVEIIAEKHKPQQKVTSYANG